MADVKKGEGLVYRNHPLRRVDNLIYYGSMADEYVCTLQIVSYKEQNGEQEPDKIQMQLLKTDPTLPILERLVKNSEKNGLYNAIETAAIWLDRVAKA